MALSHLNTIFALASMGVLPVIIEKNQRKDANSLNSFFSSGVDLVTPLIAGIANKN